jgi:hypothetical protein
MFGKKKNKRIDFLAGHEKIEELIDHLHLHRKKRRNWLPLIAKTFLWSLISIVLLALISGGILAWRYREVYGLAISGKNSLEKSLLSAKLQNFDEMLQNSQDAEAYFSELLADIRALRDNFLLKRIWLADNELSDLEHLLRALSLVSSSMEKAALVGQEFKNVMSGQKGASFTEFSRDDKQTLLKMIYEFGPEMNGVKANLELALLEIDNIRGNGILAPLRGKISDARNQVESTSVFLGQMSLASELLPEISGYPQKSAFLVLFQNSDELRPSGGFLGTYGILETDTGDIARFDTHDIYHMDMPLEATKKFNITPPDPIRLYLNNKWYLRDSNWSPDWPTAAEQILWFYKQEDALLPPKNQINNFDGEFNGVIGITPELVKTMLSIIGPVTVAGETYDQNNFTSLLEYKVEQDYVNQDISSWERKEVIGDILEEIKIRMFNLPYSSWQYAFQRLSDSAAARDLQIYFKDKYLNDLAKEMGLGGEIKESAGDYWLAVDANLGARKSDAVVVKTAKYQVRRAVDGLYAKLTLNYAHGGTIDWRTDDYKTYTRIYAPAGSRLIKISGIAKGKAESSEENGKAVFGAFFDIKAGSSGSAVFEYKLPNYIEEQVKNGEYKLYIQKQAGSRLSGVEVDFDIGSRVKSYEPENAELKGQNNLIWSTNLLFDRELEVEL